MGIMFTTVVGGFASMIDPAWAIPVNTFLLLLISLVGLLVNRKVKNIDEKTDVTQSIATDAAQAAASAASAASDSARITREIGAHYRKPAAPGETSETRFDDMMEN